MGVKETEGGAVREAVAAETCNTGRDGPLIVRTLPLWPWLWLRSMRVITALEAEAEADADAADLKAPAGDS